MNKTEQTQTYVLLEPATGVTSLDLPSITLCGRKWVLNEYAQLSDAPAYTCISYSWGQDKVESPLHEDVLISARTIPAIEAAINSSQNPGSWEDVQIFRDPLKDVEAKKKALKATQAFWIDALCIPQHEPNRTRCLQSMGAIYSAAWQVFVVLPASCTPALRQMRDSNCLDSAALLTLENDDWITRAWTYQETVNSQAMYFLAQDDESTIVSGLDFLNAVLTTTDDYKRAHGIDSFDWSAQHPKLENLENMIADYRIAAFGERSAYQVMSAMHPRLAERTEDHLFAMVGAISKSLPDNKNDRQLSPSEYFMRVCQTKGDFSFIYNTAPRNGDPGRRWRPIEGRFPPVLPGLLVFGNGLSGCIRPTHVQLENTCCLVAAAITLEGLKSATAFLSKTAACSSTSEVVDAILARLKKKGFSGCGEYMELENGFFFPQSSHSRLDSLFVAISPDVQWTGGCPGMLLRSTGTGVDEFRDVGAFVGKVPVSGESICVG